MADSKETRRPNGLLSAQPHPAHRFLGVQWRLVLSHLEVAVGACLVTAVLIIPAVARRSGLVTLILWGLLALAVVTVGGAWVGIGVSRRLKLRLREASRFASALARGDYRHRISVSEGENSGRLDEIDQLAGELNAMADGLEAAIGDLRGLAERNRALAEEAGRFAALEERTRLARDLHDTVNQQVFSLSMQAAAARRRLETAGVDGRRLAEVGSLMAEVEALARSAHRQMRDLILQLRPTTLEQQGLGPALDEYSRTFAESAGLRRDSGIIFDGRLNPAVEEALFRIAQEALNNVAKHSGAKGFEIGLAMDSSRRVNLRIRDDGRGFDPARPVRATALGFRGLRERAAAHGGWVKIESAPGQGTTIEVSLPAGLDPESGAKQAHEEDESRDPHSNLG